MVPTRQMDQVSAICIRYIYGGVNASREPKQLFILGTSILNRSIWFRKKRGHPPVQSFRKVVDGPIKTQISGARAGAALKAHRQQASLALC